MIQKTTTPLKGTALREMVRQPIAPPEVLCKIGGEKFRAGDIILAASYHPARNIDLSVRLALQMAISCKGKVLYINTMVSHNAIVRKTLSVIKSHQLGNPDIEFMTIEAMNLVDYEDEIRDHILRSNVKAVVVNSWEYASQNGGQRNRLANFLITMRNDKDVALICFTQEKPSRIVIGEYKYGQIGRLANCADRMIDLNVESPFFETLFSTLGAQQKELRPEPKEVKTENLPTEKRPPSVSHINNLQPNGHHVASGGVISGT